MSQFESSRDVETSTPQRGEVIPLANEFFRVYLGDRFIEIANYDEPLTQSEIEQITAVFQRVSAFTDGKVFDRVSGLDLMSSAQMKESRPPDAEELEGDYDPDTQKERLNLGYARHLAQTSDPGFSAFREKYFPGRIVTPLQFALGHELFHSIDIQDVDEVAAHGIDKDRVMPSWRSHRGKTDTFSVFMDPWLTQVTREAPPTPRAMENPREDFAESGAIAALGGDMSTIPARAQTLRKAIELAKGRTAVHSLEVNLIKVA